KRFIKVVTDLSRSLALCAACDEATEIRADVAFMQAVQAALNKHSSGGQRSPEDLESAIRHLVTQAIVADGQIIDVFTAAGLKKPDISILSDQFLAEVRGLKHRNVAAELLEKLLKDEIKVCSKRNLVQAQLFSDKLKVIAAESIKMVRKSVTIDWNLRDGARAKIRVIAPARTDLRVR
ncbi:MAG: type I restriction enzyme endonuclease domain-containing protein, partial [Planctomycetota bacterium]